MRGQPDLRRTSVPRGMPAAPAASHGYSTALRDLKPMQAGWPSGNGLLRIAHAVLPEVGCRSTIGGNTRPRSKDLPWKPRTLSPSSNAPRCWTHCKRASNATNAFIRVSPGRTCGRSWKRTTASCARSSRWRRREDSPMWSPTITRQTPTCSTIALPKARQAAGTCATTARRGRRASATSPRATSSTRPPRWASRF